jgi:tetratricopeptide (TPR) repeat protein
VTTDQNHYEVLGISEDASESEIEKAFYRKVREHPPEQDEDGHKRVREAYDVLINQDSRDEYDALRRSGGEIEQLKDEAERLLSQENPDFDSAIRKLKKAVVLGPEIGLLRNQLGSAYLQSGQPNKALEQFNEAIDLDNETSASYRLNRGHALRDLDRHREAENAYREVWEEDKGFYAPARGLAAVLFAQDKAEEAHDVLEEAIWADDKLDFEDFFCYYDKLQLYVAEGRTEVLREELETVKGLPETEDDRKFAAFMLSQTGQMLVKGGVYSLAQNFMDAAVELDPENPELRAAQEVVQENAEIEGQVESLVEDSAIHDFVKHAAAVFYEQYAGIVDEQEAKEQIDELNAGIQNVMQVDPDNTEIKESVRRVRDEYPEVFELNPNAFETILGMPDATARVDDCPHCGDPIQFGKGDSGKGKCGNCLNEIEISGRQIQKPSSGCFVATAVYGSYKHPDVIRLRQFRDDVLLSSKVGSMLVSLYYRYGPYLARRLRKREKLKNWVRKSLELFVDEVLSRRTD